MHKSLLDKVWELHTVREFEDGRTQLFIGLHLIHEVTSQQAFGMLKTRGMKVAFPQRTFGTIDHIVPTKNLSRPLADGMAESAASSLEQSCRENGIKLFGMESAQRGIVHVIGPELGLTQPGMTIACGDSHTSTHGAFGSLGFGIGTTQVGHVLATQCLMMKKPNQMRAIFNGKMQSGVHAKDLILSLIRKIGVSGAAGHSIEYSGEQVEKFSMEQRMTICNMSIEAGARIGYVNPDSTTYEYVRGREFAPSEGKFEEAIEFWDSIRSEPGAAHDKTAEINSSKIEPMVTWGINPGQSIGISEELPYPEHMEENERRGAQKAYEHMKLAPGKKINGLKVGRVFIGSCTNSRLSDLVEASKIIEGKKIAKNTSAIVVPGSQQVKAHAEQMGLHKIFTNAGFEWRNSGCSMCLGLNPDKLSGDEICASTSNRNFIGRQGSPLGRTLLMSPAMAAAAAISGEVCDVRDML